MILQFTLKISPQTNAEKRRWI